MDRLDALIIATDLYREIPGEGVRDRIRLSVDSHPATLEFLFQYFRWGKDASRAFEWMTRERNQRVPLPLNGPFLYQYLRNRGLTVEVVPFFSMQKERLLECLEDRPRAVVISTTFFPFAPQIEAVAAFVKERAPETLVIAGGIQVWKSYRVRELIDRNQITPDILGAVVRDHYLCDDTRPSALDILVVSDCGEFTLSRLLHRIREGLDYGDLENIAIFREGAWQRNPVRAEPNPFMEEPMDWGRLPADLTRDEIPVHAGTGCAYRCAFCDFCTLRPLRRRPMESLIREIRSIPPSNGVRHVFFTDDNLFVSKGHVERFCRSLEREGLDTRWRAFVRVDTIDPETADMLARSGCRECLLGVESGDEELLRRMNKKTTPQDVLRAVGALNRVGINTQSTFLVGFPGETETTVRHTIDLLNAYPTGGPGIHVYYPFFLLVTPLAPVASPELRARYGLKGYLDRWSHDTMRSEQAAEAVLEICDHADMALSPIYHGERIVDWMSVEQQKRVIFLRNRLNRIRRGILPREAEEPLWNDLEQIFSSLERF